VISCFYFVFVLVRSRGGGGEEVGRLRELGGERRTTR